MGNGGRDADKEAFWRQALARHGASGLSVAEFCRREKLSQASFYAWRRTLAERDHNSATRGRARPEPPAFLPVVVDDDQRPVGSITIELAGGRLLRLPESIAPERLAELIQALEASASPAEAVG